MKTGAVLVSNALMCIITGISVYWFGERQHKKVAVVNAVELFDKFNLKVALERRDSIHFIREVRAMDSVRILMGKAMASGDTGNANTLASGLASMQAAMEGGYKERGEQINRQVWAKLNTYMADYGKKRGLHLIIGANGMGTVLYLDGYYDATTDAVKFANQKYEQGN